MLLLAGALDCDRHQLLAANPLLDQLQDLRLAWRIEMTDRIETDEALCAQRALKQIEGDFPH